MVRLMLYKFNEIDENLKINCNRGCGKKFKYKDGLFVYDKLNNNLHFYCEKCANFVNEVYYQHMEEYDKEWNISKINENEAIKNK